MAVTAGAPLCSTDADQPTQVSMVRPDISLPEFYREQYEPWRLLGCSQATKEDYRYCLLRFARLCGTKLIDLTGDDVVGVLGAMTGSLAASTVNKYRRYLRAVLRFARSQGYFNGDGHWIDQLPKVPELESEPEGYLQAEIDAIFDAAHRQTGQICGIHTARWWRALLLVIYDYGSRISATMVLRPIDIELGMPHPQITFPAGTQKTNRAQRFPVTEQTGKALVVIYDPDREKMFPWPHDPGRQWPVLTKRFRKIISVAGVAQPAKPFHKLRATSGSLVEASGGDGAKHLGHRNRRTFEDHYRDRRICLDGQVHLLPRPHLPDDLPDGPRQLTLF